MYLVSNNKDACYGCFACADACPVEAIQVKQNDDTFLYPKIDTEKCISCRRCESVCPEAAQGNLCLPIDCFSGIIRDHTAFSNSSSGGAFAAIIQALLNRLQGKHLYVAGVVWDNDFQVVYRVLQVTRPEDIAPFNKSKYVHCNPVGVYKEIAKILEDRDNIVVFSGTPCQASAAISFLGGTSKNLITVDLACHGAPSQAFFDKYRDELERSVGSRLTVYSFRNKEILDNGTLYTRSAKYTFENCVARKVTRFSDPFLKAFYEKPDWLRESCLKCKFKTPYRVGDFTIGDSWGIEKKYPEIHGIRGVSFITFNSDKSLYYREAIRSAMTVYDSDYNFLIENNAALRDGGKELSKEATDAVTQLWRDIKNPCTPFSEAIERYFGE